jgi:hypothetical protein
MSDCRWEFGLDIGFIDHLHPWLRTTSNNSTAVNLNSQITTAPTQSFPACCVFTSCSLVTASNSGDSSVFHTPVLSEWWLPSNSFLHRHLYRPDLITPHFFVITSQYGLHRQHHSHMLIFSVRMCLWCHSLGAAFCSCLLRICCLAMDVILLSVSQPLPTNECCSRTIGQQRLFLCLQSSCIQQICHNIDEHKTENLN